MLENSANNVLEFMGYTGVPAGATPITKCKCGIEGMKIKEEKITKWYHWFIPLMWRYYTAIDADPFCNTYKCPKCGKQWRTPKC